jgi:hypothetical protein
VKGLPAQKNKISASGFAMISNYFTLWKTLRGVNSYAFDLKLKDTETQAFVEYSQSSGNKSSPSLALFYLSGSLLNSINWMIFLFKNIFRISSARYAKENKMEKENYDTLWQDSFVNKIS